MKMLRDAVLADVYRPELLKTESIEEYESLREAICNELQPSSYVEHLLVADLVKGEHEKRRYQRMRARLITMNRPQALRGLLSLLFDVEASDMIDDLVTRYPTNKAARRTVSRILRNFDLTEDAIDAEATRLSLEQVVILDRLIEKIDRRRADLLSQLDELRAGLAIPVPRKPTRLTIENS